MRHTANIVRKKSNNILRGTAFLMLMFSLAAIVGCTTNNGDIGLYYGAWGLKSVTVNGETSNAWCDDNSWTTWQFQNNIVCITRYWPDHKYEDRWGTWHDDDKSLMLDFTHSDNDYPSGTDIYAAPEWLYMPLGVVIHLEILRQTSCKMVLRNTLPNGDEIVYTLEKNTL